MAAALAPRWLVGLLLAALSALPAAAGEQARRKEARVHHEVSSVLVRTAEPAATSLLEVAGSAPAVDSAVASAEAVVAAAEKEAAQQEAGGAVPADTSDAEAAAQEAVEAAEAKAAAPAAVPQSAAQLHKDKADSKKASKASRKKDEDDEDDEGGEDDEDEDDEEDDEEDGKKDKEIHYHVGKEEMGKVDLPKKWPLGPEKVLTEAGGVAVARRLLKENREFQEETKAQIQDLEDEPKFEKKLAARVDEVGKETNSPSFAKAMGKMWTEMRKRGSPFLLPVLKRREEELKEEEPELEKSLTEKGDKFQDKWTRSILKTKYGKDAAMLSEDNKVRSNGRLDPAAHSAAAPRAPALAAAWGTAVALVLGSRLAG